MIWYKSQIEGRGGWRSHKNIENKNFENYFSARFEKSQKYYIQDIES